jgi:hypothetical protein
VSQFDLDMRKMMEDRRPEIVYLNIYNVTSANKVLEFLGFGFYHTAVELFKHEFSYGGHDYDCSGIVVVEAGNCAGLTLKERIPVGVTYYCEDEIDDIVRAFGEFWLGQDYDPFEHNCNCFTERFLSHLVDKEDYYYPEYVNRFGKLGSLLRMWFKPLQGIFGDIVSYEEDSPQKSEDEKKNADTEQNVPYEPVNQDHIQAHIPRYENNHDQPAAIVIGSSPAHLNEIDHMDPYVREG